MTDHKYAKGTITKSVCMPVELLERIERHVADSPDRKLTRNAVIVRAIEKALQDIENN